MAEWIFTLETISATAQEFWQRFADRKVFAFHAAMGAGKTTFIHSLCDVIKVSSRVSSPTFSIINEYSSAAGVVYHIDLYRLKDEEEAIRAGIEDCLYSDSICLVEWPDRAAGIFPGNTLHIYIKVTDSDSRKLRLDDKIN